MVGYFGFLRLGPGHMEVEVQVDVEVDMGVGVSGCTRSLRAPLFFFNEPCVYSAQFHFPGWVWEGAE
jgi:hypothetical protein